MKLSIPAILTLVLSLVSCHQEEAYRRFKPPLTAAKSAEEKVRAGTADIQIQIPGVSSTGATQSDVPGFQINAAALQLWVDAPDIPAYTVRLPVTTHDHQVRVAAGAARTLRLEVENQWDLAIYQSAPQTLDLVAGEHRMLSFPLELIETILPIASVSKSSPGEGVTLVVEKDDSPLQELQLVIPAQAVSQPISVTIDEIYNAVNIPTPKKQASVIIDIQPHDVLLAHPAKLTFPYYQLLMSRLHLPESHLQVSRFIANEQQWQPVVQQTVDLDENTVTAQLHQFGVFVLTAGDKPRAASLTNREDVVQQSEVKAPEVTKAVAEPTPKPPEPQVETIAWNNERVSLILRPYQQGAIGIILRYQNTQTHYRFVWHLTQHQADLVKYHRGQEIVLASSALPYEATQAYRVETATVNASIQVLVEGHLVFDVLDRDIPSGSAALNCTSGVDICFEQVRITPDCGIQEHCARPQFQ